MFRIARLDNAVGGVATEALYEGTVVVRTTHTNDYDFGSQKDLPGFKKPAATTDLVQGAVFLAMHKHLMGQKPPIYQPYPEVDWALRMGFDKPDNTPFTAQVHLLPPDVTEGVEIPASGLMLAARGVFELSADKFVSVTGLVAGSHLTAEVSGADAGKLKAAGSGDPVIAVLHSVEGDAYLVELL